MALQFLSKRLGFRLEHKGQNYFITHTTKSNGEVNITVEHSIAHKIDGKLKDEVVEHFNKLYTGGN